MQTRSQAESGLSGALGLLLNDGHLAEGFIEKDLLRELSELTDKIRVAIALHVDAVTRTQMVRKNLSLGSFASRYRSAASDI
jgi:cytochrome b